MMNFKCLALFALLASTANAFAPKGVSENVRASAPPTALKVLREMETAMGTRGGYGRGYDSYDRGYGGRSGIGSYGSQSSYGRYGYGSGGGSGYGDRYGGGYGSGSRYGGSYNSYGGNGSGYGRSRYGGRNGGGGYGRGYEGAVSDQALAGVTTTERFPDQFTDSVMSRGRSNIVQTGRRGRSSYGSNYQRGSGMRRSYSGSRGYARIGRRFWDDLYPIEVQGGSLKTWSFTDVERVQVAMATNGRPLNALVELWNGPDNTPQKMGVYVEDGSSRNFRVVVECPREGENAIAIRNTAEMEFPFWASVEEDAYDLSRNLNRDSYPETIQGGALKTYALDPMVNSARVLLSTDGRPLNARIELLQGPNTNKQVIQLYTEDGLERPFCAVVETPGEGNVVRIKNTAPMEFPLMALVEPFE